MRVIIQMVDKNTNNENYDDYDGQGNENINRRFQQGLLFCFEKVQRINLSQCCDE